VRWGRFGAAGVVFVLRTLPAAAGVDAVTGPLVMLQLRSGFAHEGGTWSCAGGALDEGESALEGALREASEEVGFVPDGYRLIGQYVFQPAADWSYTTVVVEVPYAFGASLNFETDAVEWVPVGDVALRSLHGGFAAAWPHLRAIITSS
jgi:8-oxo-dGTP pyrophosphatase MutT (NUDIX family)